MSHDSNDSNNKIEQTDTNYKYKGTLNYLETMKAINILSHSVLLGIINSLKKYKNQTGGAGHRITTLKEINRVIQESRRILFETQNQNISKNMIPSKYTRKFHKSYNGGGSFSPLQRLNKRKKEASESQQNIQANESMYFINYIDTELKKITDDKDKEKIKNYFKNGGLYQYIGKIDDNKLKEKIKGDINFFYENKKVLNTDLARETNMLKETLQMFENEFPKKKLSGYEKNKGTSEIEREIDSDIEKAKESASKKSFLTKTSDSIKLKLRNKEINSMIENIKKNIEPMQAREFIDILLESIENYRDKITDEDVEKIKSLINEKILLFNQIKTEDDLNELLDKIKQELNTIKRDSEERYNKPTESEIIKKKQLIYKSLIKKIDSEMGSVLNNTSKERENSKKFIKLLDDYVKPNIINLNDEDITNISAIVSTYINKLKMSTNPTGTLLEIQNKLKDIQKAKLRKSLIPSKSSPTQPSAQPSAQPSVQQRTQAATAQPSVQQRVQAATTTQPSAQQRVQAATTQQQQSQLNTGNQPSNVVLNPEVSREMEELLIRWLKEERNKGLNSDIGTINDDKEEDNTAAKVTKSIIKKIIVSTDFFVTKILDSLTNNALKDPNYTNTANERIKVFAEYLQQLSKNEEQRKQIRQISKELSMIGVEIIDSAVPGITKMLNKIIDTIERVSSQAAEGGMRTFIGVSSSVIGQIPVLGGIINLLVSFGMAFNTATKVFKTFTSNSTEVAENAADVIHKGTKPVKRGFATGHKLIDFVSGRRKPSAVDKAAPSAPPAYEVFEQDSNNNPIQQESNPSQTYNPLPPTPPPQDLRKRKTRAGGTYSLPSSSQGALPLPTTSQPAGTFPWPPQNQQPAVSEDTTKNHAKASPWPPQNESTPGIGSQPAKASPWPPQNESTLGFGNQPAKASPWPPQNESTLGIGSQPAKASPWPPQSGGKKYVNHHKIMKTRKRIMDSISNFKNINSNHHHHSHRYTRKF